MTLPTNIDATYPDQTPADKLHQQHHDTIHAFINNPPISTGGGSAPAAVTKKKCIMLGQTTPTIANVAANPALYDSRPFDGWVVRSQSGYNNTWWSSTPISQATFQSELSGFPTLSKATYNWYQLNDNLSTAPDWTNDTYWAAVATNLQNLAAAIVASGKQFVGIFFDVEKYGAANPFAQFSGATGASWGRQRGKQLMDAICSAWPTAKLLTTYGPAEDESVSFTAPFAMSDGPADTSGTYPMMGPFAYGFLQSTYTNTRAQYLDGCEQGYYVRDAAHAQQYRWWNKFGLPSYSTNTVPSADRVSFPKFHNFAPGTYDRDIRNTPTSPANLTSSAAAAYLQRNMEVCDEYCWFYSEIYEWGNSTSGKPVVPQDWLNGIYMAIESSRNAGTTL